MATFTACSRFPFPARTVFDWHERQGAFERLTPPWMKVKVIDAGTDIRDGSTVAIQIGVGPFRFPWTLRHEGYERGRVFGEVQVSGPFKAWRHRHHFVDESPSTSMLEEQVTYELPGGPLGALARPFVHRGLRRFFAFRHRTMADDLIQEAREGVQAPMRILVSGARGLIGSALVPYLQTRGHQVSRLVRSARGAHNEVQWDPAAGTLDVAALAGFDAVVHLAGESIASGRWTEAQKRRIVDSRQQGTSLLARTLAGLEHGPKTFVCASAIGCYGDRGDELLTEASPNGAGFLPEVVKVWEDATQPAAAAGIRVVNVRFGLVLSPAGGALKPLLPLFRFGVGGRLGSGRQWWSWVGLDDVIGVIGHALGNPALSGPINVVGPNPVTNAGFTTALARVMSRWAILPAPAFALRAALGQMADELLLASQRVQPGRLLGSGYRFRHTDLEDALAHLLGGKAQPAASSLERSIPEAAREREDVHAPQSEPGLRTKS